jgi:hydroxylamine reductase (hybrid-cluster protein)
MWPLNRSINLRFVKEQQDAELGSSDPEPLIDAVAKGAATVVAVYMGCDTLRKIIVHTVATRIT